MTWNGSEVEEDLFRDLEAAAILDGVWPQEGVDDFEKTMKTWTNQAGLPLVTATWEGNTLHLEQTWYTEGEGGERLWDIPLTGCDGCSDEDFYVENILWFTEKQKTVVFENGFDGPFLNQRGMGYYRQARKANLQLSFTLNCVMCMFQSQLRCRYLGANRRYAVSRPQINQRIAEGDHHL